MGRRRERLRRILEETIRGIGWETRRGGGSRKEAEGGESVEGERWEDSKGWKRDGDWRVGDTGRAREEKGEYNMAGVEARMGKTERKLGEKVLRGKKREREMAK